MPSSPPPLLHTIKTAAARIAVSPSTVQRLVKAKKLRATYVMGRTLISEAELQRLIEANTDPANASSSASAGPDSDHSSEAKPPMVRHRHKYLQSNDS
jgi:excisionase family DNA binding protein